MLTVLHFDASNGRLELEVRAARTGEQSYPSGPEHRDASEVFASASLATWVGAPVTRGHPRSFVDAGNVRTLAIGYVRSVVRDGDHVRARLVITDARAVADIRAVRLVEASAGYECRVDEGRRQREIRINHLGLGPRGWARCGASCSIVG